MSVVVITCVDCGVDVAALRRSRKLCDGCAVVRRYESHRKYYEKNRDKVLGRVYKYRKENWDKELERQRKHYEKNRDRVLERQRKHREENRDKVLEYQRKYHEENRDYKNAQSSSRKRSLRQATEAAATVSGPFTPAEDREVLRKDRTLVQIAFSLGRTYTSVQGRRFYLGKKANAK